MRLLTAGGDIITPFVVDFEGGDTVWGIFSWDMTGDCGVEGDFIALIG